MIHYDVISNTISLCSRYYKPATFHHCLRVANTEKLKEKYYEALPELL